MATERLPITQPIESRTGSFAKDSYSSNCFFESRDQKREFIKRPGLVAAKQITPVTPPAYTPSQGLVSFNNKLVAVINNTVYQINPSSSYAVTTLGTTSSSTSQSYFTKTFLDTYLFFHNKVTGYLLNQSGAFVSMTTLPTAPYVSGAVFLDNYLFIGTTTNRIYNCNVGDPTTWDALSYLSFEQTTDTLVGIAKHLNYLIAFGSFSMQFYYDSGAATGSSSTAKFSSTTAPTASTLSATAPPATTTTAPTTATTTTAEVAILLLLPMNLVVAIVGFRLPPGGGVPPSSEWYDDMIGGGTLVRGGATL